VFALDRSRLNRLAEGPIGWLLPLGGHRRPRAIREVSQPPLFGRPFYEAISRAKIILNGAVDMAGADRGNVRCFETLGGGALMVSDAGNYPEGFTDQETMITYGGPGEAVTRIETCLADWDRYASVARAGLEMVRSRYARTAQWDRFQALVSGL
jgi:spore maturation protein CgeB